MTEKEPMDMVVRKRVASQIRDSQKEKYAILARTEDVVNRSRDNLKEARNTLKEARNTLKKVKCDLATFQSIIDILENDKIDASQVIKKLDKFISKLHFINLPDEQLKEIKNISPSPSWKKYIA